MTESDEPTATPVAANPEAESAPEGAVAPDEGSVPAPAEAAPPAEAAAPRQPQGADYVSDRAFADFPISTEVLSGLHALGYLMSTPVQALMIDPALAGKDLLVRAKTGTGKTCAFCVPVVERITAGDRKVRALMLTPTRELAIQVAQECTGIARFKDLRIAAIYGGVGFGPQEQALRDGVEIVVGTPGRVLDHVRRGNLDLSNLQFAVLDEADEMLSMGFLEDVRKILDRAPKDRQNILVSATINEGIKGIIRAYLKEPEEIYLSVDGDNVDSIEHILYETSPDYHKARALLDLIELERPASALIFCNTREDVNTVYTFLDRQGLGVEMISGELAQARREKVMARIKAGAVQFLVATDVAARGIDISNLSHVINYALPDDASIYLHRCGRTGRIGNTGIAITLAGGGDFSTRLTLERTHKIAFTIKHLPTPEESRRLQADRIARSLKAAAGTMAFEAYIEVVRAIRERPDADQILAVALRGFFQWDQARRAAAAELEEEGPREVRAEGGGDDRRRDERRPERRDDRGPRREGERFGRDGDRGPRRDGDRGPRRDGDRGPRLEGDRGPRPEGDRGPRPDGDRPRLEGDRGPHPEGDRGPRREGDRQRVDNDRGPRSEGDRGPRHDGDRGPRREGDRGPRRDGDRGPRREGDRNQDRRGSDAREPTTEIAANDASTEAAVPPAEGATTEQATHREPRRPREPRPPRPAPAEGPTEEAGAEGEGDAGEGDEAGEGEGATGEAGAPKRRRRRRRTRRPEGADAPSGDAPPSAPAAE